MLGNDIVDLQLATTQSNWRRKGYLNKIFTNEEQQEIWNAPNPETMVWLFWSMKEAAYKIVNRVTLERFFSPLKFECSINKNDGLVNFKDELIYTQSKVHSRFIHTIASIASTSFDQIQTQFSPNKVDYMADFNANSKRYILTKDLNGIPNILDQTSGLNRFASISHHGEFLAMVF